MSLAPNWVGVILFPITVGSPGRPAAFEAFAGTPTQVKMSASGQPPGISAGISLSRNVIPVAPAPSAYAARCIRPSARPAASWARR